MHDYCMTNHVHGQHCVDLHVSASSRRHEDLQPNPLSQAEQSSSLLPAKCLVITNFEFQQVNQVSQQGGTEQLAGSIAANSSTGCKIVWSHLSLDQVHMRLTFSSCWC